MLPLCFVNRELAVWRGKIASQCLIFLLRRKRRSLAENGDFCVVLWEGQPRLRLDVQGSAPAPPHTHTHTENTLRLSVPQRTHLQNP